VHWFDNLVVLHSASQPAFLLEAGVIVNRDEELVLRDPATQRRIADAVAEGVTACLRKARAGARF
jgi:N-acetylmuramoyl-L-alanine amidase